MHFSGPTRTLIGTVEAVQQYGMSRFGIKLGDEWYEGWGHCPVHRREHVIVRYTPEHTHNELVRIDARNVAGRVKAVWWRW